MTRGRVAALAAVAVASVGLVAWRGLAWGDEREIRAALASLARDFNTNSSDGLATLARAAQLGSSFSEDVVIDLGPGSAPIEGRDRVIGMATQLERRTAAYRVVLDDIDVGTTDAQHTADVTLTVSFMHRESGSEDETMDAREFALQMIRAGGRWRISRATAIDTFRK